MIKRLSNIYSTILNIRSNLYSNNENEVVRQIKIPREEKF